MQPYHVLSSCDSRVRPLPYPFLGAATLSSDVEFFEFGFFEAMMRYLNGAGSTPFGNGLGLEVTSSLFFFSYPTYNFSYFSGAVPEAPYSRESARLNDYLRSGWIDTIHAYGDFDGAGGFVRRHAERCYEALAEVGVTLSAFTNHGGTENIQNIGTDAEYHCGDRPGHHAYHVDLMRAHGVRYVWTDSMIRQVDPASAPQPMTHAARNIPSQVSQPVTPLVQDTVLQDGSRFAGVTRLRSTGANAPNLSSLGYQLRLIDWPALYATNGAVAFYQHFGVLHRNAGKCVAASVDAIRARPEVFLSPFNFLAIEQWEGRLWVCGFARLLTYADMVRSVQVRQRGEDVYELVLPATVCVSRPEEYFQGLTLYIDSSRPFNLYYGDRQLPLAFNGPDRTGHYSVSVPLLKLANIW